MILFKWELNCSGIEMLKNSGGFVEKNWPITDSLLPRAFDMEDLNNPYHHPFHNLESSEQTNRCYGYNIWQVEFHLCHFVCIGLLFRYSNPLHHFRFDKDQAGRVRFRCSRIHQSWIHSCGWDHTMSSRVNDLSDQFEYTLFKNGFQTKLRFEKINLYRSIIKKTGLRQLEPVQVYGPSIHLIAPPSLHWADKT